MCLCLEHSHFWLPQSCCVYISCHVFFSWRTNLCTVHAHSIPSVLPHPVNTQMTHRCECRCASSCRTSDGSACHRTGMGKVACPSGSAGVWRVWTIAWTTSRTACTATRKNKSVRRLFSWELRWRVAIWSWWRMRNVNFPWVGCCVSSSFLSTRHNVTNAKSLILINFNITSFRFLWPCIVSKI